MSRGKTEQIARGLVRPRPRRESLGADWGTVDAVLLRDSVATISLRGGAVRLGYTRDGGAYAIGVYGLGEPYTEYVRPSEDVEGYLRELAEAFVGQLTPQFGAAADTR